MLRINRSFLIVYSIFIGLLFGLSLISYEMFHLVVTMSSIFFGFLIYILVVNSTISTQNTLLLTIGTLYLFVGLLDFTHAVSFEGLNFIFTSTNESAQIWVAARFLEAAGFLIALTVCRSSKRCFSSVTQILFGLFVVGSIYLVSSADIPALVEGTSSTNILLYATSGLVLLFLFSFVRLFMIDGHLTGFGATMMIVLLLKIASIVLYGFFYNYSEQLNVIQYLLRMLSYGALYIIVVKEVLQNPQQNIYNKFAKKQTELLRLSQLDQLTNIYNHKTSFSKIEEFLEKHNKKSQVYLAMIDIDDFKVVNDTYGHQFGDRVLKRFSKILFEMDLGIDDRVVGRYGGDEFIVALKSEGQTNIPLIFAQFSKKLQQEFDDVDMPVTCSVGLVLANKTDTVKDLVYKADIKMYESKQKGKDQLSFEGEQK